MPGGGQYKPLSKKLDIEFLGRISLNVKNILSRLGALLTYRTAVKELAFLLGIHISHMTVKRSCESVGEEALKLELKPIKFNKEERISLQIDGGRVNTDEGWKEVKVAMVAGNDSNKSLQMSRMDDHEKFTDEFASVVKKHGYDTHAKGINAVNDGAQWISDDLSRLFPDMPQVLDCYHYEEHLHGTANEIFSKNDQQVKPWVKTLKDLAFENKSEEIISCLQAQQHQLASDPIKSESLRLLIGYTENNKSKILYGRFKELGYEIGSGKIEGRIKAQMNTRIKSASIRWKVQNVKRILALRDVYFNDQWEHLPMVA